MYFFLDEYFEMWCLLLFYSFHFLHYFPVYETGCAAKVEAISKRSISCVILNIKTPESTEGTPRI